MSGVNWPAVSAIATSIAAFMTLLAALVALFGERIRAHFFRPSLRLEFPDAKGSATPVILPQQDGLGTQTKQTKNARYYRLSVKNKSRSRWPAAKEVRVLLLKVEEPRADESFFPIWSVPLQMEWTQQTIDYQSTHTIGPDATCDLCSIVKDGSLQLRLLITPLALKAGWSTSETPVRRRLTLQAQSIESDSNVLCLEFVWDGKWADDSEAMANHMVIRQVPLSGKP